MRPRGAALFEQLGLSAEFDSRTGDIRDTDAFERVVLKPGRTSFSISRRSPWFLPPTRSAGTFATNVMGTVDLLSALRRSMRLHGRLHHYRQGLRKSELEQRYRETDALGGHDLIARPRRPPNWRLRRGGVLFWGRAGFASPPPAPATSLSPAIGRVTASCRTSPARCSPKGRFGSNPRAIPPWQHVLSRCGLSSARGAAERSRQSRP